MNLQQSELLQICHTLINALFNNVAFQNDKSLLYDMYWTSSFEERYDLYNKPELTIGSITHDLERLTQCLNENNPMLEHFRYLGNILIAIADTIQHRINQGESIGL